MNGDKFHSCTNDQESYPRFRGMRFSRGTRIGMVAAGTSRTRRQPARCKRTYPRGKHFGGWGEVGIISGLKDILPDKASFIRNDDRLSCTRSRGIVIARRNNAGAHSFVYKLSCHQIERNPRPALAPDDPVRSGPARRGLALRGDFAEDDASRTAGRASCSFGGALTSRTGRRASRSSD